MFLIEHGAFVAFVGVHCLAMFVVICSHQCCSEVDTALYGPVCGMGINYASYSLYHRPDCADVFCCFLAEENRPLASFPCFAVCDVTLFSAGDLWAVDTIFFFC